MVHNQLHNEKYSTDLYPCQVYNPRTNIIVEKDGKYYCLFVDKLGQAHIKEALTPEEAETKLMIGKLDGAR